MTNFSKERPSRLPYIVLAVSIFLATSAVFLLIVRKRSNEPEAQKEPVPITDTPATREVPELDTPLGDDITPDEPEVLQLDLTAETSQDVASRLAGALESGDIALIMKLTGNAKLDPAASARLKEIAANRSNLSAPLPIRKIEAGGPDGEDIWEVVLPDDQVLSLNVTKTEEGWVLNRVTMTKHEPSVVKPVEEVPRTKEIAAAFVESVLNQDFERAKRLVEPDSVSDAKIAGLCILFEEGDYQLRQDRAIREVLQRADTAVFLINLNSRNKGENAQFGMTLRGSANSWKVAEVNLDRLLADYAANFGQGDVYYTPLVKNPEGGDTLALYFDFDSQAVDKRAERQLEIVSRILKADKDRKINISGHTDALGTEDYNQSLSRKRADQVRDFLVSSGVPASQVVMDALGASQPRRPNVTDSGEDNPEGRRVNRRAEIYLDF